MRLVDTSDKGPVTKNYHNLMAYGCEHCKLHWVQDNAKGVSRCKRCNVRFKTIPSQLQDFMGYGIFACVTCPNTWSSYNTKLSVQQSCKGCGAMSFASYLKRPPRGGARRGGGTHSCEECNGRKPCPAMARRKEEYQRQVWSAEYEGDSIVSTGTERDVHRILIEGVSDEMRLLRTRNILALLLHEDDTMEELRTQSDDASDDDNGPRRRDRRGRGRGGGGRGSARGRGGNIDPNRRGRPRGRGRGGRGNGSGRGRPE